MWGRCGAASTWCCFLWELTTPPCPPTHIQGISEKHIRVDSYGIQIVIRIRQKDVFPIVGSDNKKLPAVSLKLLRYANHNFYRLLGVGNRIPAAFLDSYKHGNIKHHFLVFCKIIFYDFFILSRHGFRNIYYIYPDFFGFVIVYKLYLL